MGTSYYLHTYESVFKVSAYTRFYLEEMLSNALRSLVYEPFLEIFYWENDKIINVVDNFYISHESNVKTFLL